MKQVTAAVIIENGRLFLAQRPTGDPLAGMWELPGGKMEAGESPQECLERELGEEFGMSAEAGRVVASTVFHYQHGSFEMIALSATRHSEYALRVHDSVSWVDFTEIANFRLAPADVELVAEIIETGLWSR